MQMFDNPAEEITPGMNGHFWLAEVSKSWSDCYEIAEKRNLHSNDR
jgi:hypothetical protein